MPGFAVAMRGEIAPIYAKILEHPFNRELAAGRLGRERFVFYMIQDAHYLGAFARALATAAARATTADAQVLLAKGAHDAIIVERALHEEFFVAFGVTPEEFAASRPAPTCRAYADFLVATAFQHDVAVGIAAVLPCFHLYHEVGKHLHAIAVMPNPYQRWIDTYRDEAFGDAVRAMLALADAAHDGASERERRLMGGAYRTAARFEWMFWDAAWRLESWPV